MPDYFAAFLDLRRRHCLVVGGGPIAERKALGLLECGARVLIVSPAVTSRLRALAASRTIQLRARRFRPIDVRGCVLAVAATGVAHVDDAVAHECRRRGVLVNVVDRPALCDFIYGSVLRRGELQVAVSTGGRAPALAREVRRRLEGVVGPELAELVEEVGRARQMGRRLAATPADRLAVGEDVVRKALGYGRSSATGTGVAGTSRGVTAAGGRTRSTEVYCQPKGAVRSASGLR